MIEVKGDLIRLFKEGEVSTIAHQVNCMGVMGGGIAKTIRNEYPELFSQYSRLCRKPHILGTCMVYPINNGSILNLFGQFGYSSHGRSTNYIAFSTALRDGIISTLDNNNWNKVVIGIPKYIGCGLGGGKWDIIISILEDAEKMYDVEFLVVDYSSQ